MSKERGGVGNREHEPKRYGMPQRLILVSGHVGAGKTHVSKIISGRVDLVCLNKDNINDAFSESRKHRAYHQTAGPAHEVMHLIARTNLQSGMSVIFDAPYTGSDYFPNQEWIKKIQSLAEESNVPIKVVWCTASPDTKQKRILARGDLRDREMSMEEVILKAAPGKQDVPDIPFDHLVLDTDGNKIDLEILDRFLDIRPR